LKLIVPILLLLVISFNHLNIINAVWCYNQTCHSDENEQKDFPADEETEKENSLKEKAEEQEKYYTGHGYLLTNKFQLPTNHKFICFSTILNKHPYQDDDIQPPKAV